ncbi:hypothetical protein ASG52_24465 [Methylobacterium sp. Leaf456]|nr:hypothetical protein ASG52_24465 [Methylobacterium sp. Leaf456]
MHAGVVLYVKYRLIKDPRIKRFLGTQNGFPLMFISSLLVFIAMKYIVLEKRLGLVSGARLSSFIITRMTGS